MKKTHNKTESPRLLLRAEEETRFSLRPYVLRLLLHQRHLRGTAGTDTAVGEPMHTPNAETSPTDTANEGQSGTNGRVTVGEEGQTSGAERMWRCAHQRKKARSPFPLLLRTWCG